MIQLQVYNYASLIEAKITVDGLTLLKGPSSSGKSSFIRAIYAALNNRFLSGCVRHSEEAAQVCIKFPESNLVLKVVRSAQGGSPIMRLVDKDSPKLSKEYGKLNRDVPADIREFCNLGYINLASGDNYSLNFYNQFDKPLLLAFTPKRVIEILSHSKTLAEINAINKVLGEEANQFKGEFRALDSVLQQAKNDLHILNQQKPKYEKVSVIKDVFDDLETLDKRISNFHLLLDLQGSVSLLQKRLMLCKSILTLFKDYDGIHTKVVQFTEFTTALSSLSYLKSRLSKLNEILSTVQSLQDVRSKLESINDLASLEVKYEVSYNKGQLLNRLLLAVTDLQKNRQRQDHYQVIVDLFNKRSELKEQSLNLSRILSDNLCPTCGTCIDNIDPVPPEKWDPPMTMLCPPCRAKMHRHIQAKRNPLLATSV